MASTAIRPPCDASELPCKMMARSASLSAVKGSARIAGRNIFEFGPGITAVVGPNGSGKSNLADALRWVLGEQNPRTLRSRRADDQALGAGGLGPLLGRCRVARLNIDGGSRRPGRARG